jgi:molybdenum cofactor biosynthesis protein B
LLSGGTGLSSRDGTYEVVQACLDKELTGFGELFRYLSYGEIGSAAMMSRATAGVAGGTVIVSMPGSSAAVRLAMEQLILPELAHMSHLARG